MLTLYVVALNSENRIEISTSIHVSTRPWTNHRSLWPRPHANISKAIWRTLCPPSCLSLGRGELVWRIESNMPFCMCLCYYTYAYALVKTSIFSKLLTRYLCLNKLASSWAGIMYNLRNSLKNKYQPLFKGSSGFGSWKQQNDDYWWLHD